ncbi:MAG TPA: hypothetical protein VK196_03325 [Magnetospirillum sp.]|nr:hypothetical protein [Magnetospirillum sp.]
MKSRMITCYTSKSNHAKAELLAAGRGTSISALVSSLIADAWRNAFADASPDDVRGLIEAAAPAIHRRADGRRLYRGI